MHQELLNPSYSISIGVDFIGLIKGIMYIKDDVDGHTALMPTVPPNFNYKQKVRNDVYIFFSFKKEFLTAI